MSRKVERIVWIDMAKAIAILLMIVGHEINSGGVRSFIFSFHMPLFFILSGYTAHRVTAWHELKRVTFKLFKRIWLLAALMIGLLGVENYFLHPANIMVFFKLTLAGIFWGSNGGPWGLSNVGVMWFLFAYFWARIFFNLIRLIIKDDRYNGIIFAMVAYGSYLLSQKVWLPQALDIALVAAFFMWIGAILHEYNFFNGSSVEFCSVLIALVFWLLCIQSGLYLELSIRSYPNFVITFLEAVAGTIVVCYLSRGLLTSNLTKWLVIFGRNTMILFCVHHLDLYWGGWEKLVSWSWLAALLRLGIDIFGLLIVLSVRKMIASRQH